MTKTVDEKKTVTTPSRSGRTIPLEVNITREWMQHIFQNELELKPMDKKKVRLERAKELFRLHEDGLLPNLVFFDEKPFHIEQFVNKQSERVFLPKKSTENLHL